MLYTVSIKLLMLPCCYIIDPMWISAKHTCRSRRTLTSHN